MELLKDQQKGSENTIVLVDASHLAYRNFFRLSDLRNSEGIPTGLFFGFFRSLIQVQKLGSKNRLLKNSQIITVWDSMGVAGTAINPEYKANREITPEKELLFAQMVTMREACNAAGYPVVKVDGAEADSLIGVLAYQYRALGKNVLVFSGDNDMLQLVDSEATPYIKAYRVSKNGEEVWANADVIAEFGVVPHKVPIFRAVVGDKSDNLRGVARFPRAALAKAVADVEDVEGLFSSPHIAKQWKDKLEADRETVVTNFQLMKLVPGPTLEVKVTPDKEYLQRFVAFYELKSIKDDLLAHVTS